MKIQYQSLYYAQKHELASAAGTLYAVFHVQLPQKDIPQETPRRIDPVSTIQGKSIDTIV
jgi:hypothetical protein